MDINNFLKEVKLIKWFEHNTAEKVKYHVIYSIFEAYDDWNNQMLKVWEPNIKHIENMAINLIGNKKIDEVFSKVSEQIGDTIWKKWEEFVLRCPLEEETGLEQEITDMIIRDISWAYIERMVDDKGFFTELLKIYKSGFFPCAWIGEYPNGQAVVL